MMKKFMFLFAFVATTVFAHAQAVRLGSTKEQIENEFSNNTWTPATLDGQPAIATYMGDDVMIYLFNNYGQCYVCEFMPAPDNPSEHSQRVDALIEVYNEEYIVASAHSNDNTYPIAVTHRWIAYIPNGNVMYINLNYNIKQQSYAFWYTSFPH